MNLVAANSFHGDKLIRLSANDSFKHGYVQIRRLASPFLRNMYIYIYINTADAFNRVDISSFGFHGNRKGGPKTRLVFVEKKHRLLERSILDN